MRISPPERLAIVTPNWLGDAVMALPLVADIRRAWPGAHITAVARGSVAALFALVEHVDDVMTLQGGGGVAALGAVESNARALKRAAFDAVLLLPNSFVSAWMAARAAIPERWGFRADGRGLLLTRALRRPKGKALHQAEYYRAIGSELGLEPGPLHARLTVPDEAAERGRALLRASGVPDGAPFAVMAPGAAYGRAKQWLPERFAELARLLAVERRTTSVLVGTRADAAVCADIASRTAGVVNLSGKTDLPALAAVLSLATMVVANDSGAMHLAGAVGARVVGVFGATNERKTAPLLASAASPRPAIVVSDVWCRPCMLRECPIDHRCMTAITARRVFAAVSETL